MHPRLQRPVCARGNNGSSFPGLFGACAVFPRPRQARRPPARCEQLGRPGEGGREARGPGPGEQAGGRCGSWADGLTSREGLAGGCAETLFLGKN